MQPVKAGNYAQLNYLIIGYKIFAGSISAGQGRNKGPAADNTVNKIFFTQQIVRLRYGRKIYIQKIRQLPLGRQFCS